MIEKNKTFNETTGDLLYLFDNNKFDLIGHGCNCFCLMGAGIAYSIKHRYPLAYNKDLETTKGDKNKLGTFTVAKLPQGLILNIYSQFNPGMNFDKDALVLALKKINVMYAGKHIGLPLIGCGIAGGDWEEVKQLIKTNLNNMNVTIVHFIN